MLKGVSSKDSILLNFDIYLRKLINFSRMCRLGLDAVERVLCSVWKGYEFGIII